MERCLDWETSLAHAMRIDAEIMANDELFTKEAKKEYLLNQKCLPRTTLSLQLPKHDNADAIQRLCKQASGVAAALGHDLPDVFRRQSHSHVRTVEANPSVPRQPYPSGDQEKQVTPDSSSANETDQQKKYFVKRGKTQKGPFPVNRINKLLASGKLRETDLLSESQDGPWKPLNELQL
jgi:hypothetical protein